MDTQNVNSSFKVTNHFCFTNYTTTNLGTVRDFVCDRSKINNLPTDQKQKIKLDEHSFERWNTRVGPAMEDQEQLEKTINFLFSLNRIKLYPKRHIGVIDEDILFTYGEFEKNVINITTFYGRLSLKPFLSSFSSFRNYNLKNRDNVMLELDEETLAKQCIIIPKEVMYFEGKFQRYVLEKFETDQGEMTYITVTRGKSCGVIEEIDPQNVDKEVRLNPSCQLALQDAGYGTYVHEYLQLTGQEIPNPTVYKLLSV